MFKNIPRYEDLYTINEHWVVISKRTNTVLSNIKNWWYLYIWLTRNGITERLLVHRIVWELFVENPKNHPWILHLDNDLYNCYYKNLKWWTPKQNSRQRDLEWRANNHIQKNNPYLWKTWELCHNSKELYQYSISWEFIKKFPCSYAAGKELWISRGNISSCLIGKRKTAWWFIFSYLPPSPSS